MGYNSDGCNKIRGRLNKKFWAPNTSLNIYLPSYNNENKNLDKNRKYFNAEKT
jgi:hypothetical protein